MRSASLAAWDPRFLGTTVRMGMGEPSTVGIWTHCPVCSREAVAVVQFADRGEMRARLLNFRCPGTCRLDAREILRTLRLSELDRAS